MQRAAECLSTGARTPLVLRRMGKTDGISSGTEGLFATWFEPRTSRVLDADINVDGTVAATVGGAGALQIWRLPSAGCQLRLPHDSPLLSVAMTPDARLVVTGDSEGHIQGWDLQKGTCSFSHKAHEGAVKTVAISPDGRLAITGGEDSAVRAWDLTSHELVCELFAGHRGEVMDVAVTADGRFALACYRYDESNEMSGLELLKLWDLQTQHCVHDLGKFQGGRYGGFTSGVMTPDGARVAVVTSIGDVYIWDLAQPDLPRYAERGFGGERLAISADGVWLVGIADGKCSIWNASSGRCIHRFYAHAWNGDVLAITPDASRALTSGNGSEYRYWNLKKTSDHLITPQHILAPGRPSYNVLEILYHPKHGCAVTKSFTGKYRAFTTDHLDTPPELGDAQRCASRLLTSDDHSLFGYTVNSKEVRLCNTETLQPTCTWKSPVGAIVDVALTHDNRMLAAANENGGIHCVSIPEGELRATLLRHIGGTEDVAFLPDGRFALSSGSDGSYRVWDVQQRTCVQTIVERKCDRYHVLGPQADLVFIATENRDLRAWHLPTGRCLWCVRAYAGWFNNVFITPDESKARHV